MKKLVIGLSCALFLCVCAAAQNQAQNSTPEAFPQTGPKPKQEPTPAIEMVLVKGGTFTMGCVPEQESDCDYNSIPAHQVTLNDFYIGKYEVTQKQWREIMGVNIRQQRDMESEQLPLYGLGDEYPMYYVNWYETHEFISRLNEKTGKNYRLPTEAEWEYAARGGNQSRGYKYSGSNAIEEVSWYYGNSGEGGSANLIAHPVGTKKENELGIHDMTGNVWEWVSDLYGEYGGNAQTNPKGPETGWLHVLRGGSWFYHARPMLVSFRGNSDPTSRTGHIGFRLASDIE